MVIRSAVCVRARGNAAIRQAPTAPEVEIEFAPESRPETSYEDYLAEQRRTHQRLLELRPETSGWASTIYTRTQAGDVFQPTPVADIAYRWVEADLKWVGWVG